MSDASTTAEVEVTDNPGKDRYEARLDGNLVGFAQYIRTDELIAFVHTEVERAYEGRGVGSALVRASLDAARADGFAVLAVCPFYTAWIGRHREYQDLLYSSKSRVTD
ncbi:GNAT family N-acetyltransferase [Actinomadura viridis]|uniref:GNAT family N-acetyltransferase n=1 Tax=Actinomadura viridis TaxID=58110 RepID=UPI00369D7CDB